MVGNVNDVERGPAYDAQNSETYAKLPSLDKWLLGRLGELEAECYDAYAEYQFQRAANALSAFAVNELSALYLDVAKDRLYVSPKNAARRRSCQAVLVACLDTLPKLLAPLLPHLAEELHQALPYVEGEAWARPSVFEGAAWARGSLAPYPPHAEAEWGLLRSLRDDANRALEAARRAPASPTRYDASTRGERRQL